MPHREIIEDICKENGEGHCTLREILSYYDRGRFLRISEVNCTSTCRQECVLKECALNTKMDDRLLEQLKCIEELKYNLSREFGDDVGWEHALKIWVQRGYAKKFADVYSDGMKHKDIDFLIYCEKPAA